MAGIYVHIPFCASKCVYCDFYSIVARDVSPNRYVEAVVQEGILRRNELSEQISTLYIGGGTPSVLPDECFKYLINGLKKAFDLNDLQEFTVEVNPDDVCRELVKQYKMMGVNRVSMGIQSLDDRDLTFMNRRHSARQALEAISLLKEGGIANISIDLIFGVPGQTLETWQQTVNQALTLGVEHVSAYNLSYEEGTLLWKMRERGEIEEMSDEVSIAMLELLCELMQNAGFEHYEISNFAKPGFHSRHNSGYWTGKPYLGLGAAAHSYDGGSLRSYNPADVKRYVESIERGETVFELEQLGTEELHDEMVMLRLRTACGLDTEGLRHRFGVTREKAFIKKAQPFVDSGALKHEGSVYSLTRQGIAISNVVMSELMAD